MATPTPVKRTSVAVTRPVRAAVPAAASGPPAAPAKPGKTGIREQGYRHWQGNYTGHWFRWWTITKASLRSTVYTKGRLFLLLALVAAAWIFPFFVGMFYFFFLPQLPIDTDPNDLLRDNLFNLVTFWQWMWAIVFSAVVGSRFVASDLRSEAFYIYLSKPIRRIDYFVGKVLACMIWVSVVTILPALWVYLSAAGAATANNPLSEGGDILEELIGLELLLMLLCSTMAVSISSLTKRWALALVGWLGLAFLMIPIAEITADATRDPEWKYISPVNNIWNVAGHQFEMQGAFQPEWTTSVWILLGLAAVALGVFLFRVWKLEAAE